MKCEFKPYLGFNISHPWYYLLGGLVPSPKQIRAHAKTKGYGGYMADDIEAASRKSEPQRSEALRAIKAKVMEELQRNLSRYRELARELRLYRCKNTPDMNRPKCHSIHSKISLKFAHIFNDFAHLNYIDSLPELQGDLFDL